jgi:hypothetical protein
MSATILAPGCDLSPRTGYMAAVDEATGEPLAFLIVPDIVLMPGTITATGSWQPPTMHVATLSGLGPVGEAYVNWNHIATHGTTQAYGEVVNGAAQLSVLGPPMSSPRVVSVLQGIGIHTQYVLEDGGPSYALDGSNLLPFVNGGGFDYPTRTATWTTTTGDARPDLTRATAYLGDADYVYTWAMYMPGQPNVLVVPETLPVELGLSELAVDNLNFNTVFLIESDDADYYGLLSDLDLYDSETLPFANYRPDARVLISGGYIGARPDDEL